MSYLTNNPGMAMTDWQTYTPTLTGFGTVTSNVAFWKRDGDSLLVQGKFVSGTPTAVTNFIGLPTGINIDTTKITANQTNTLGMAIRAVSASSNNLPSTPIGPYIVTDQQTNNTISVTVSLSTIGSAGVYSLANGSSILGSGDTLSYSFRVPIAQWTSNVVLAVNTTEYASNSSTSSSNDTTSFVNGPAGSLIPTITAATGAASVTKGVQFVNPILVTDSLVFEIQFQGSGPWIPLGENHDYAAGIFQGGSGYGMSIRNPGGLATNRINADFGTGGTNTGNASFGGAGSSYPSNSGDRWRIRKTSGPNAMQLSGTIIGQQNNVAQLAGYVGETISSTNSSGVSTSSTVVTNVTSITLTPGSWIVTGMVNLAGATLSQVQGMISTSSTTQTGTLFDGSVTTISFGSASISSSSLPVGPQIWRVAAGTTQQLFLNAQASGAASTAKGSISATRFM